ncbi:hypothetical protein PMIN06_001082 [Paraphaeosphaeria minitans]|uniref:Uncharacterized protein n=1 Tax=Paraphaeosphaeria minitans TaxID=565426 RepID=A0A9P6GS17_9PLEO|nr:hypothetical protein PMIN01_02109 [Paraphaeosphaeria minitans]
MPYLLHPPEASETSKPTYAVSHSDAVDEIILQDLRRWGWRVEETTSNDPKWLAARQEYHKRMEGEGESEENKPSLWNYWRKEDARRVALENDESRARRRLTKSPRPGTASSHRSSFMRLVTGKGSQKLTEAQAPQVGEIQEKEMYLMSGANQEQKTIAEIRQQTAQKKEASEDWNRPDPAKSLGQFDLKAPRIYHYGTGKEASAVVNGQLELELLRNIKEWVGIGGILKTTQVSVMSEIGICVDDKGERVHFPPKWNLPLFPWEEEVSRSSSTKSKDSSAKSSLEYVTADFAAVFEVADGYQEKDEPDQETHSVD